MRLGTGVCPSCARVPVNGWPLPPTAPPLRAMAKYIGRCDQLCARDLHAFDETAVEVTHKTAKRWIGALHWRRLERVLGYTDADHRPINPGLTLASDYAVRFEKGTWKGRRAFNVKWSGYHHIFLV